MKRAFFLFSAMLFVSAGLYAEQPSENLIVNEHSKVVTVVATPYDPGQIEFWNSYAIQGGKFAWGSNGGREHRGTSLTQRWDSMTTVGVYKDIDIAIMEGFEHLLDKENNSNEVRDLNDPGTGGPMEGAAEGPTHGFGWQDLGVTGHWRFYNSPEQKLEIAYVPTIFVPTGRRSNLDHIGPSQGYTSFDNAVAFTQDISRWNGTLNLGYNSPLAPWERTNHLYGTAHANFAVGYQVFRWLQPEIELIFSHDFGGHGRTANLASVVLGCVMPVNDHVRFEIGVQQDVFGSNEMQTTSGIFSVAFLT
jgi:hypothetical protein